VEGKCGPHHPLLLVAWSGELFAEVGKELLAAGKWEFSSATNGTHCSVALQL